MATVGGAKTATLFRLALLGIATSGGPAAATAWDTPAAVTEWQVFVPTGWDTRMGRNFGRNYNTSAFDRRFDRRDFNRNYDNSGFDRPSNHFLNTPGRR
jgi:hypothetical protein